MNQDATATLARFASGLVYDDIPARVRSRTKDLLLDAAPCALAGYRRKDKANVTLDNARSLLEALRT